MRLEYYSQAKLEKQILKILAKNIDLRKFRVFFFGSRVAGRGSDRSDIDVGVEGDEPIPLHIWFDIREAFENLPTLYKVEIVDFKRVSPRFRDVALHAIEEIGNLHHHVPI